MVDQQQARIRELERVLREVKFSLNACQMVISDPEARATVRDLVAQADEVLRNKYLVVI